MLQYLVKLTHVCFVYQLMFLCVSVDISLCESLWYCLCLPSLCVHACPAIKGAALVEKGEIFTAAENLYQ